MWLHSLFHFQLAIVKIKKIIKIPGNNIDRVIYREICYVWQYTLGFNWILLITVYLETCQLIMNIFSCEWCNFLWNTIISFLGNLVSSHHTFKILVNQLKEIDYNMIITSIEINPAAATVEINPSIKWLIDFSIRNMKNTISYVSLTPSWFGSIVTDNLAKGMLFPFLLPQQSLFIWTYFVVFCAAVNGYWTKKKE